MYGETLRALLQAVARGETHVDAALEQLAQLPFTSAAGESIRMDTHRALRQGMPETIFGEGKTSAQITAAAQTLLSAGQHALVTRVSQQQAAEVCAALPQGEYIAEAKLLWFGPPRAQLPARGRIAVVCAGTSDLPVAKEALETARCFGNKSELVADVGVAGLHRLLAALPQLRRARVCIAVAGMEGALPSVLGGLVAVPVIAVPSGVGYGVGAGGFAALAGMLTSCAPTVACVNIGNGFGAAVVATLINRAGADENPS